MPAIDPELLLAAYASGIFPMADSRDAKDVHWVEPRSRAVIPIHGFRMSRSLAKAVRSNRFAVTRDRAFAAVLEACADRDETWINHEIETACIALHARGHAHSIECWRDGKLAGGLYGVRLGGAFFGESMFSRSRDASKVALAWLVARLRVGDFALLDCQFMTPHLAGLGAVEIGRKAYLSLLSGALSAAGAGVGAGAGAEGRDAAPSDLPPDFGALDVLLDGAGAVTDEAPVSGWFIAQLLGQTS